MFRLGVALAGLFVLGGCNRSARDEVAHTSQTAPNREIAGAMQPSLMDTAAANPRPASQAQPRKPPISRNRQEPAPTKPAVSPPASSARIPEASPEPGTDSSSIRDTSASRDTIVSRETAASGDTMGYSSYAAPAPDSARLPATAAVVSTGTIIHVSLQDSINSRLDTFGKQISGKVMENVRGPGGAVLVRAGTPLRLTVTRLRGGRGSGKGDLEIRPDSITINGHSRNLAGKIGAVPYQLKGRGVTGGDAAKVGVGAVGGAVAGRVITGKTKGAVVGGVIGAAGGAVVASQTAVKDVVVTPRTPVDVVLTAPLVIR
jgi:hypothetical protein